jgi:hypothetical protein
MDFNKIFDKFWTDLVPFPWNRNAALRAKAERLFEMMLKEIFEAIGTPAVAEKLIAMQKIGRMLQAARVISQDPNPDPEQITTAVQAMLQKLRVKEGEQAP